MSLLILGYCFYTLIPNYDKFFSSIHRLPGFEIDDKQILLGCVVCYSIFLIPFYLTFEDNVTTKSRHVWNVLFSFLKRKPTHVERVAILSTLVKAFFLPLMLVWLVRHIASIYNHGTFYLSKGLFFPNGYWMLFNIIFLVDVTFFTLGYALEHPKLNNEIRSVDPWVTG